MLRRCLKQFQYWLTRKTKYKSSPRKTHPRLEILEDRLAPTVGIIGGPGTHNPGTLHSAYDFSLSAPGVATAGVPFKVNVTDHAAIRRLAGNAGP